MPICVVCLQVYDGGRALTCSQVCHDEYLNRLVKRFGEYRKVVRASTGEAFKVPTRDILEKGIKEQDLGQYPKYEGD